MTTTILRSILAVCCCCAIAGEPVADAVIKRVSGHIRLDKYEAIVAESALVGVPVWSEEQNHPPLSPRAAMRAAEKYYATNFATNGPCLLNRVALEPVGTTGQWLYIVELSILSREGIALGPQLPLRIVVLLDGRVVGLRKLPGKKEGDLEQRTGR